MLTILGKSIKVADVPVEHLVLLLGTSTTKRPRDPHGSSRQVGGRGGARPDTPLIANEESLGTDGYGASQSEGRLARTASLQPSAAEDLETGSTIRLTTKCNGSGQHHLQGRNRMFVWGECGIR